MKVTYQTAVFAAAGWRQVEVTAEAEQTSPKMATVTEVLALDGEKPQGTLSRTGAKRQQYNASGIAQREVGARKRLSSCRVLEEV